LIFEYSNSNLITMEAELEFVQLYIDLEELRFGNRVTCTLSVSDNVEKEKDILQVPPLLVQPIIENSFKHGLFHKLDGGEVNISYSLDGDTIVTVVEDNGIGRDASNLRQNSSYDDDRYSGLKNIMHRLEIFGFNMPKYANSMLIEDLYMNGEACGTRTILNVTIDENKKAIS
ncbi:MAG: sensor histidine kinase YesM, partial [Saprospiraceae bacterium]